MELPSSSIAHLQIPLPSAEVQARIIRTLDDQCGRIDAIVLEQDRAKQLLDERFAANRASRLLRGFNPITGAGVIPVGWQLASLGAVARLQRGFDLPTESREAGDVPVVSSGGVSGHHSTAMCQPPGVVTGRYGTIGRVFYIETEYWPLNTTLFVLDFRGNHPRWLFHLLAALPLDADSAKSAVTGINRNVVGQLRVLRPPLDEQIAIAADLDAEGSEIERIQAALSNQVNLLTERKHALITRAVMGDPEVP
jgi:type I restriction enzyme S subunit